jgi:PTS system, glucose subfamily, IIA component
VLKGEFMFFKKKELEIVSPVKGKLISIKEVPDVTFSEEMVGKGVAVLPEENELCSPADGTITTVFPTLHAIGLTTKDGIDILLHIGLDTVNLKGEYFDVKVKEGDEVKAGDLLVATDFEKIKLAGYRLETPVIICNPEQCKKLTYTKPQAVNKGDVIIKYLK